MRILIVQKGITTTLYAPPSLAGLCFALKDHFDNIDSGYISIVFDKVAERTAMGSREDRLGEGEGERVAAHSPIAQAAAILNPSLGSGGEETKSPGMRDVPH